MTEHTIDTLDPQPSLAAAGTAQRISTVKFLAPSFLVVADKDNTGNIHIGDPQTLNLAAGNYIILAPGEAIKIATDDFGGSEPMLDANEIYFCGDTTADKIVVTRITRVGYVD